MRTSLEAAPTHPAAGARVFTVPPGAPFLKAIATAILQGNLPEPGGRAPQVLELPAYTLLMPTRRAARALQEAFLEAGGGRAMLLPTIRPIAQGDEDLALMTGLIDDGPAPVGSLELAPAVSAIERRLALTTLVMRWSRVLRRPDEGTAHIGPQATAGAGTPAQAAHLAAELARLMDMVETERPGEPMLDKLAALVPEDLSEHWQKTIDFLEIVTASWPAYLAERGLLSPADRRNRAILAEAHRLAASPPKGPVIVAGVTGSIPATVELMRAVVSLPHGAIVLPGLDTHLDAASWAMITAEPPGQPHPEHPQFGPKRLLDRLGLKREDVRTLGASTPATDSRCALIAETMRPSGTTARWYTYAKSADRNAVRASLKGVSLIEAPSAQDEAEAVALILREAAETPGRTAALISPDRLLARRVAVRLEAWGIRVDDSAGRPFAKTVPGTFLDLVISAITKGFAPAETMALLKHPLTRLGLDAFQVRRAARAIEIAVLRHLYLGSGLKGLATALAQAESDVAAKTRRGAAVQRLWPEDWQGAHDLLARLASAYAPLTAIFADRGEQPVHAIAAAHVATAEALARVPETNENDGSPLWRDEAGTAASAFFLGLVDATLPAPEIRAGDYADFYRSLIQGENVRPRVAVHPRLFIWGPLEARLQQADVMVLGSLNDGTWPEAADPGPWLNRPMRAALGLPSPEERIGHAAHDFTSFLAAPNVFLTRAQKIDGVPTVPSRWLMRLQALLSGLDLGDVLRPDKPWIGWARARDAVTNRIRIEAPEPRPSVDARPRKMSVTKIETWLANPYAIFASHVLKLDKLPLLGAGPDAALRGSIVHDIMRHFAVKYPRGTAGRYAGRAARDRGRGAGRLRPASPHRRVLGDRGLNGSRPGSPRLSRHGARAWCVSWPRSADN